MNMESQIQNINVDLIIPNRFQPRLTFDENALNELSKSIKEHGIIQPLVLRRVNDKYEIIAGERRYKAAVMAGLTEVPAIITAIDDNKSAEVALVENVQRKNLNSMEEAKSYKKILDKGYLTQEALAQKMGISQSTLSNKLRLLNLAPEVQDALMNNRISERHARSLLTVNDQIRQISLLNRIISERLTVRQLDEIIKKSNNDANGQAQVTPVSNPNEPNNQIESLQIETLGEDFSKESEEEKVLVTEQNIEPSIQPEVNQDPTNIFDNPLDQGVSNDEQTNINEEKDATDSLDSKINDEEATSAADLIDSLDKIDDDSIPTVDTKEEQSSLDTLLSKFTTPKLSSLEDEKTNMDLDTDDYFNPFNNLDVAESLPVKEEKEEEKVKEVIVEVPVREKIVKPGELDSVKEAYEKLKQEIIEAGFKISSEDFDFEDIYQLMIKIDKQA